MAGRMIISPMPTGNGAYVVHRLLSQHIENYRLCGYPPATTFFPPLLRLRCRSCRSARLVHTTPDYGWFFASRKVPLILTFHNYVLDKEMQAYGSLLQRIHWRTDLRAFTLAALRRATVVTAVSHFTAEIARDDLRFEGPIRTIFNGVDADLFRPPRTRRDGSIRVLFSGNPSSRKGAQWLPEIAARLDPGIELVCTGGLRGSDSLTDASRIRFLGPVAYERMPDLYRDADMLVMPTVREGLSLAILEAMASGLPVVASRCSSIPEQIEHGAGGMLVEPGDIDGYAGGINRLAADRQAIRLAGEFNRAKVERLFTLERMIGEYRDLFAAVLDGEFSR